MPQLWRRGRLDGEENVCTDDADDDEKDGIVHKRARQKRKR